MIIRSMSSQLFTYVQRYLQVLHVYRHRVSHDLQQEIRITRDQVSVAASQLSEQIIDKQQSRDYLVDMAAHDLNNYLTGIAGLAEVAQFALPASHAACDDLNEIKRLADRAGNLATCLLARTRPTTERRLITLNQIVADAELVLHRIVGDQIVLATVCAPELGLVEANPDQIEQVLINLVLNARDALLLGGTITITTAAVPSGAVVTHNTYNRSGKQYIVLSVTDTGIGMDATTQARMFEPFFTTKASHGGSGIGLLACKQIIDEHGGEIAIVSNVGRGTVVKIYLPCH